MHAMMPLRVLPDAFAALAHGHMPPPLERPEQQQVATPPGNLSGTRYRYPGLGTFELRRSEQALYLHWLSFPAQAHLLALPDGRLWNRKDGAVLSVLRTLDGQPDAIEWRLQGGHTSHSALVLCPRIALQD